MAKTTQITINGMTCKIGDIVDIHASSNKVVETIVHRFIKHRDGRITLVCSEGEKYDSQMVYWVSQMA